MYYLSIVHRQNHAYKFKEVYSGTNLKSRLLWRSFATLTHFVKYPLNQFKVTKLPDLCERSWTITDSIKLTEIESRYHLCLKLGYRDFPRQMPGEKAPIEDEFGNFKLLSYLINMGLFPVLRSKGWDGSMSFTRKSKQNESGCCFHLSRTSNSPAKLPSK